MSIYSQNLKKKYFFSNFLHKKPKIWSLKENNFHKKCNFFEFFRQKTRNFELTRTKFLRFASFSVKKNNFPDDDEVVLTPCRIGRTFSTDPVHRIRRNGRTWRGRRLRWRRRRSRWAARWCCAVSSWPNGRWRRPHCSASVSPGWPVLCTGRRDLAAAGWAPAPGRIRIARSFRWPRNRFRADSELPPRN